MRHEGTDIDWCPMTCVALDVRQAFDVDVNNVNDGVIRKTRPTMHHEPHYVIQNPTGFFCLHLFV